MIDIQKLWEEAGGYMTTYKHKHDGMLKRFAHLIREAVVQELVAGSGEPTLEAHEYELWGQNVKADFYTADQLAGAVLRERERCAKVCEKEEFQVWETAERIAAAIRIAE